MQNSTTTYYDNEGRNKSSSIWKGCFGTSKDEQISLSLTEVDISNNNNTFAAAPSTTCADDVWNNDNHEDRSEIDGKSRAIVMTLDELELMLERYLYCASSSCLEQNEEEYLDQTVHFTRSLDAHVLKCRTTADLDTTTLTITGMLEHLFQNYHHTKTTQQNNSSNTSYHFGPKYIPGNDEPYWKEEFFMQRCYASFQIFQPIGFDEVCNDRFCCCPSVHGNWTCTNHHSSSSIHSNDFNENNHKNNDSTVDNSYNSDDTNGDIYMKSSTIVANFQLIDLTHLQSTRRKQNQLQLSVSVQENIEQYQIQLDTPGKVFHFLRSVLSHEHNHNNYNDSVDDKNEVSAYSLHSASPWKERYNSHSLTANCENNQEFNHSQKEDKDLVVGIIMYGHVDQEGKEEDKGEDECNLVEEDKEYEWYEQLEQREVNEFQKFRIGDAAPSYYLHSTSSLQIPTTKTASLDCDNHSSLPSTSLLSCSLLSNNQHHPQSIESYEKATLFIYRRLSPRDAFSVKPPTNLMTPPLSHCGYSNDIMMAVMNNISTNYTGTLWESYVIDTNTINAQQQVPNDNTYQNNCYNMEDENHMIQQPSIYHRQVATPYQSLDDIFPNVMNAFFKPENIQLIIKEALDNIPLWTAWPERNHYSSTSSSNNNPASSSNNTDSTKYPSSWTVFPLCHTFPAYDITTRKWIDPTCACVPETVKLLKTLGPVLRTALFSRLEPGTKLNSHTGWADLANHVCRVHVPLLIPESSSLDRGLCGLWVDGCIETQVNGKILCFDDSKVHRAFNYTNEERIVLIIDLARPTNLLPIGTAIGGHTEELDAFIQQFT